MAIYVLTAHYSNYNSADLSGHSEFVFEADEEADALLYFESDELTEQYKFASSVRFHLSRINNFHHVDSEGVCDEEARHTFIKTRDVDYK